MALAVRQAFLKLIPRQEIVERIITPLNPEAEVRQSYTQVPSAPGYGPVTEANGMAEAYPAEGDLEGAAQLLEDAGVETPVEVRFLTAADNVRRQDQLTLITQAMGDSELFEIVDVSSGDWGSELSDNSLYDASMFGWQSTSTAVTAPDANFRTGSINNMGDYSNDEVDGLFDQLQTETDPDAQIEILSQVETILVEDGFGNTLYQHPLITGYNSELQGVDPIALAPTIFWNFWEWSTTLTDDGGGEESDA